MAAKLNIGTVLVKLLLDDEGFGPDLKKAEAAVSSFGTKSVAIAADIDRFLTRAFLAAASAVAAVGTAAAVTGAAFEKQMSKVSAISGATADEMAALTKEARRIGSETLFSATEAARGMEALAQAGFTPRQIIAATADAMNLAGASGMELGAATELVAATLTQFGLAAEDAGRVTDVLTQVSSSSLFTMEDLAVSMRYAGAAGAAMGYSLEETAAAVAQFRNAGLTGEQAGTNFRGMLESIANPSMKAQEAIAFLGLTVDDLNPSMHSFDEIMQTLHDSNMDVASSFKIFGTVSGANVARLAASWDTAKTSQTGYANTLNALMNSQGVAAAQFSTMADNVAGRFDRLSSSVEDALLAIFEAMKGPLSRMMDGLTARVGFMTKKFTDSSGEVQTGLDRIVDGVLALVDQLIILSPYVEEVAALMFAALVGAKGIQWVAKAAELADAFGVNLAGAAMKAVTAMRAMSLASAAFTVTGVGAALAGIALLVAAVAKLWTQYTGATKAARELAGELAGQANLDATAKKEQEALGETLALQQQDLRARLERGEALSAEENQILRLTAATAYQMKIEGELLDMGGRVSLAANTAIEDRKDQILVLKETADRARLAAGELGLLAEGYREIGAFDAINDKWNETNGVLQRASLYAGRTITSLEDLKAAQAEAAGEAQRAENAIAGLTAGIDETRIAANEAAASSRTIVSGAEFQAFKDGMDASNEAAKAAAKEAEKIRDAVAELASLSEVIEKTLGPALEGLQTKFDTMVLEQQAEGLAASLSASAAQLDGELQSMEAGLLVDTLGDPAYTNKIVKGGLLGSLLQAAKEFGSKVKEVLAEAAKMMGKAFLSSITAGLGSVGGITGLVEDLISGRADAKASVSSARAGLADARRSGDRGSIREARLNLVQAQEDAKSVSAGGLVDEAVDAAIAFIETLAAELPAILDRLTERIPDIVNALAAAMPAVVKAVVKALPSLLSAIVGSIPALIGALTDGIVTLLIGSPKIITAVLSKIPDIILAVVKAIPRIVVALVRAVPSIIGAVIRQLPRILFELLLMPAKIVTGLVKEIVSGRIFVALWKGVKKLAVDAAYAFLDLISFGVRDIFKKTPNKDKKGVAGLFQDIGRLFQKKDRNRHPDGIPYVPHTMSTVLEPGEAVLTAMDNWERRRTNMGTPGPVPRGGASGGGSVEVVVMLDGKVTDAIQARAMADGRAPKMQKAIRASSGARVGFSRGPLAVGGR